MKNYLLENYKLYCPIESSNTVEYKIKNGELIATLTTGAVISYDDEDKTIRYLPNNLRSMSEDETKKEFSLRLSRIMRFKRMTQKDISEITGITQSVISLYLSGKASPSLYKVYKIAQALDCSIDELVCDN